MYEFIASNRSEELRENCLLLLEQDILFGIQVGGSQTTDPRLSRKVVDPRLQRGSKEVQATSLGTVEEIPLHHPFLSRSEISKESEDWFMKLVLWANKGGPQGSTFTSHLLSVVAQLIASIGSARPNFSINSAQSLSFLMSGKHPFVQGMSKFDRENLVRATHRLLRSASVYVSDPEGHMQKLRSAVSIFETTSNMTSEESTITGKKRDIAIREEDLEEVEEAADIKKRRISEALEAAENQKRNQLLTHAGQSNVTNVRTQLVQSVTNTEFTELATDLAAIELSLVTTEAITLNQLTLSDKVSLQQLFFAPTCLNLSAASALSCATLQQIIIRMFSVLEIFPEVGTRIFSLLYFN
jgi:NACalpha-BTF3-like transcription factor